VNFFLSFILKINNGFYLKIERKLFLIIDLKYKQNFEDLFHIENK